MGDMAELLLSDLSKEEVVSRPICCFPQMLENLLEAGAISCNELKVIKHQLDSPQTAPLVMYELCRVGHLHLLQMALQHRPGLATAAVDDASSPPLHVASRHGQLAAVRMLLNAGADLQAVREGDGWTALHEAAAVCGGSSVAEVLLRSGAQVDHKDKAGRTAIQLAMAAGNRAVTELLCSAGAKIANCTAVGSILGSPLNEAAELVLRSLTNQELVSRPLWLFPDVLEILLEADTISCNHLEVIKLQLDSLETGPHVMRALCRAGHLNLLRMALQHRPRLASEPVDNAASMPLHMASRHGQPATVRMLLNAGADLEVVRPCDGWTALHEAAACGGGGGPTVAGVLLRSGAQVECRDKAGRTPLHLAAAAGNVRTVRMLLGATTEQQGGTALLWAAEGGRSRAVATLVKAGVNVNVADEDGRTPLHWAAEHCDLEVVRALLEAGADKSSVDKNNVTPLHVAAQEGHAIMVRLLLKGTDVSVTGNNIWTPLHYTARYTDSVETARELLVAGADITAKDKWGDTPLHLAARGGHVSMVRLLLKGTDVNVTGNNVWTPLHYTARYTDSVETARELLAAGADSNARDTWGSTPLHHAAQAGNVNMTRLLLETTDVNVSQNSSMTPLHFAASRDHLDVTRVLLEAGADKVAKDKDGKTAHDLHSGGGELKDLLK